MFYTIFQLPFVTISGLGTYYHSLCLYHDPAIKWALGAFVCGLFFGFTFPRFVRGFFSKTKARIVPYFEKCMYPGPVYIRALYTNRELANEITLQSGVVPLLNFGLDEESSTDQIRHDAASVLDTFKALQKAFGQREELGGQDRSEILTELALLVDVVGRAADRNGWFQLNRGKYTGERWSLWVEQGVGDIDSFSGGYAIAEHCQELDQLGFKHGLKRLSFFGFKDDKDDVGVRWHEANAGLDTVRGLLEILQHDSPFAGVNEDVISDLEKMNHALERAASRNILFALILRLGSDELISPYEMDTRRGTFW